MALQVIPELPMYTGTGIRTPSGMLIPLGKVACFLSSQGADYYNDSTIANIGCAATLTAAAAQCRTGRADIIVALPGHSENLASAAVTTALSAAIVAGTKLVGIGTGSAQPTIRWTGTDAAVVIGVDDVSISGMYLKMEGASGVVAPLTVGASTGGADFHMKQNRIKVVTDNTHKCTTAITVNAYGSRFEHIGNQVFGAGFAITDYCSITGAADGIRFCNNKILAMGTAANGFVNVSAAATHLDICDNDMVNDAAAAAAPACLYFGNYACTGICAGNRMGTNSNSGLSSATGIVCNSTGCLVRFINNYNVDVKLFSGVLTPVVTTG